MLNLPLMRGNILPEDIKRLVAFLQSADRFTQGPMVREFERRWSAWLGVRHSVFVNSGSSANILTMAVLRELYGPGEVLVPAVTWPSDITSVLAAGLTPVLLDVELHNLAMGEQAILSHITPQTRAVFLSHLLGFNGLKPSLLQELKQRGIPLIEDVCESHGALYTDALGNPQKCGTAGLASNFSFYYAHHMSTIEGGMICTNDDTFYQYLRLYRSHGMLREADDPAFRRQIERLHPELNPEFLFLVPGYNMRSTELNAVIGLSQLERLDGNIQRRRENYAFFYEHLDSERYYTDFSGEGNSSYAFVVLLRKQNSSQFERLTRALNAAGVEYRRGTAGGGNQARQPFLQRRLPQLAAQDYPNAERLHHFGLYTGNYPGLEREQIQALCRLLNSL